MHLPERCAEAGFAAYRAHTEGDRADRVRAAMTAAVEFALATTQGAVSADRERDRGLLQRFATYVGWIDPTTGPVVKRAIEAVLDEAEAEQVVLPSGEFTEFQRGYMKGQRDAMEWAREAAAQDNRGGTA